MKKLIVYNKTKTNKIEKKIYYFSLITPTINVEQKFAINIVKAHIFAQIFLSQCHILASIKLSYMLLTLLLRYIKIIKI